MGLADSWSFRQRPTGTFRRFLRLPIHLFRWRLGFLLGDRFLLITHRGRTSGRTYQTPVEVVEHDHSAGEYIVCSGTGPRADWYQNLIDGSALTIQVGNHSWTPRQRFLLPAEAARRFAAYETAHPRTARTLLKWTGNSYDGSDEGRLETMQRMPMVAFSAGPPA